MTAKNRTSLTIYPTLETMIRLKEECKKESRSMNNFILLILNERLNNVPSKKQDSFKVEKQK